MDGDLFLNWLSARRDGKIPQAAEAAAALVAGDPDVRAARQYLRRLEDLGHLDLDWASNTWRIRPRALTHLPGSSAIALLLGERPGGFQESLDSEFALQVIPPLVTGGGRLNDPAALLLEYDNEAALQEAAQTIGATFVSCAAVSTAHCLEPLQPGPQASGPAGNAAPIQMFTPPRGFTEVGFPRRDGLFRQLANGRYNHWIFQEGDWMRTTLDEGICLVNGRVHKNLLEFHPTDNDGEPVGTLTVDGRLSLPTAHRRCLTLCSGLSPVEHQSGARGYPNVPASVARAVAKSLHQELATT
ncbi:hypothetical protein [Micrococcus terreus]|uniref:hypothetical protein n=1 Tax=Micrococcus terreus TaxID=574650 RepID=UPI003018EAA4